MTDTMQSERVSPPLFAVGLICSAFATAMALVLVLDHFGGLSLPGCGEGSGCDQAANSEWGKVPGIGWPVSFVGLAYFAGMFFGWLISRNGVSTVFRYLIRLGALLSVMFIVVMVVKGTFCKWCLAAHVGNLAFWVIVECSRRKSAYPLRAVVATVLVFVLASGTLFAFEHKEKEEVLAELSEDIDESTAAIIQANKEKANQTENIVSTDTSDVSESDTGETTVSDPTDHEARFANDDPPSENIDDVSTETTNDSRGFTGRYRLGPEKAAIRLVLLTDYQCPDCRAVEMKVREVMESREDVSLSIKHFPMDKKCNEELSRTLHGNACWAARAAETAGILRGNEGFFEMHHWLFDNEGKFTDQSFPDSLRELGYDPGEFIRTMTSPLTMELVKADVAEGRRLGLRFTPMIFINGVQLRGIFEQNAHRLIQSINKIAAQNPPHLTAAADRPPGEVEKYIGDWKASVVRRLPPDSNPWARGPEDAKLKIVVWGDYQEIWTVLADRAIVKWLEGKPDVQYSFRHFPFNQDCNPVLQIASVHPDACMASQAVEAAGLLGGLDGYWKMHNWVMDNRESMNEQSLRQAVVDLGFDADEFFDKMASSEVAAVIEEDCRAAKRSRKTRNTLLWRGAIPTIYINGRNAPWWRNQKDVFLDKILDAAYTE